MNSATAVNKSQYYIDLEKKTVAHNYEPLPVVLSKGEGVFVWDVEGKCYYDFLSGYSAVNQGHCHPKILSALIEQAKKITLTSRAFYNDVLVEYAEYITDYFGYDKVLPMNTGVEAVETAIKLIRKWAYSVKGVPKNEAKIIVCKNNFHGRTSTVISFSSDAKAYKQFGPYMPGFIEILFNNLEQLKTALQDNTVAGFLVEPIQGEAGVIIPDDGYLSTAKKLCEEANVLFAADEIQTGLCRTGKMLACDYEDVRPDILILGKALSGGMLPISAVLADDEVMLNIKPGQHGSTFGGNPLACKVAMAALQVIKDEDLAKNSLEQGNYFREQMMKVNSPYIKEVRGKGLFNAIELQHENKDAAENLCKLFMKSSNAEGRTGLLAKSTHGDKIRLAPPLTINRRQMDDCLAIIKDSIDQL
jgi:ornithine--oxo-acid transaminase